MLRVVLWLPRGGGEPFRYGGRNRGGVEVRVLGWSRPWGVVLRASGRSLTLDL